MSYPYLCVHCSDPLNDKGEDIFTGSTFCGANPTHDRHESEMEKDMSETTETTATVETPADEKTFGIPTDAITAIEQRIENARTARDLAVKAVNQPLALARQAIRDLLPTRASEARSLGDLLEAMTVGQRTREETAIDETYDATITQLSKERDEVINTDPFTQFVHSYIRPSYGDSYAEAFYRAMPLTFDGLQKLAHEQRWCTDFERVMMRAVKENALPDDRVEVEGSIHWTDVPHSYEGREEGVWKIVLKLPRFVRLTDNNGHKRDVVSLRHYAGEDHTRYVKVLPEGDDSSPADVTN